LLFTDLKLIKPILDALQSQGYEKPTPIQEQAIPSILEHRDVFGTAQTGTGKTAAFAIPILQNLTERKGPKNNHIKALILTPTRDFKKNMCRRAKDSEDFNGLVKDQIQRKQRK